MTGRLAYDKLCSGWVLSYLSLRIGDENNVDNKADTVGNISSEKNKLLRSRDSFFSGEPEGVVDSDLALANTPDVRGCV